MDAANTGSYNARAYTGDSPGSSSDSKSPNSSAIPTCVVTPTSNEKGYVSYDDDTNMGAYIPSRKQREFIPESKKDDGYWEKRRKNNEAARRSREKRRFHDMALENRIMDLTRDNCKLRNELTAIKKRFGIPLNDTFISDDDDPPPVPQRPPHSNVSPPRTPAQHAIPSASLSQALQQKGPSVQQNTVRARSYSGSIALQYQGSYTITNTQKPPYQTSVSPIDTYYPNNSGQRESGSRYYSQVQPQDYSTSKSIRERTDPIPLSGRSDLTERSAYSSNVPPSMVPQYNSSLSGTNPTSYWQQSADLTSSDSEGDWGDQVQEEPLSLVKKNVEENNSSNSDLSNNSSRASNSPTSSSALPLKLRHKVPLESMPTAFPTTPNIPRYANGLDQLSEIALASSNLPLTPTDDYNGQLGMDSFRYRSRSFSNPPRSPYDKRYVERRRKNNEAARKCRENRKRLTKIREVKSGYLESENGKLKEELTDLQVEMKQLREMLEKKQKQQNRGLEGGENDKDVGGDNNVDSRDDMDPGKLIIETKTEPIDEFEQNGP